MSRISDAFVDRKVFIGFVTGGDPTLHISEQLILEMAINGAGIIEIGIPFSDPIAEGEVIQNANLRALSSGATIQKMFELVENVRKKIDTPLVFLTYLNPVYKYGYDKFFAKCEQVGLDGIIIPDLPFEEQDEVFNIAIDYNIDLISLIAPTSEERIKKIAKNSRGFVYIVSSMGVTGVRSEFNNNLENMIKSIKQVTNTPCAIGFGISTAAQAKSFAQFADGVIVGSAIVKIVEKYGSESIKPVGEYVAMMSKALGN